MFALKEIKRQAKEKISENHISNQWLVSTIHKELIKLKSKEQTTITKNSKNLLENGTLENSLTAL